MLLLMQHLLEKNGDNLSNIKRVMGHRFEIAKSLANPFLNIIRKKTKKGNECYFIDIDRKKFKVELIGMEKVVIHER